MGESLQISSSLSSDAVQIPLALSDRDFSTEKMYCIMYKESIALDCFYCFLLFCESDTKYSPIPFPNSTVYVALLLVYN